MFISLNGKGKFELRTKSYVDHWDTQAVHLSVEGSLWSSSNNYSLGNTLSSISDRTALLLFTMMEIANSNFPLGFFLTTFPQLL